MGSAIMTNGSGLYKHTIAWTDGTWTGEITLILNTPTPIVLGVNAADILGNRVLHHPYSHKIITPSGSWMEQLFYAFSRTSEQSLTIIGWKVNDKAKLEISVTSLTDTVTPF